MNGLIRCSEPDGFVAVAIVASRAPGRYIGPGGSTRYGTHITRRLFQKRPCRTASVAAIHPGQGRNFAAGSLALYQLQYASLQARAGLFLFCCVQEAHWHLSSGDQEPQPDSRACSIPRREGQPFLPTRRTIAD